MPTAEPIYALEPDLGPVEFLAVLHASGLAARRPVDDPARIAAMLASAQLIATARVDGAIVGVARAITDYARDCYLCDLAVDRAHIGHGIGRALIAYVHAAAGPQTTLTLIAAPAAVSFYERIGLERPNAFTIPRQR